MNTFLAAEAVATPPCPRTAEIDHGLMLLAFGDRFKTFGIAHASLRKIGKPGTVAIFGR
jgi:hypothetical protein